MANSNYKTRMLARRRLRVRKKITGDAGRPRLSVYRSLRHIYAQIIDDSSGQTLAATSSLALKISGSNMAAAAIRWTGAC